MCKRKKHNTNCRQFETFKAVYHKVLHTDKTVRIDVERKQLKKKKSKKTNNRKKVNEDVSEKKGSNRSINNNNKKKPLLSLQVKRTIGASWHICIHFQIVTIQTLDSHQSESTSGYKIEVFCVSKDMKYFLLQHIYHMDSVRAITHAQLQQSLLKPCFKNSSFC